MPSACRRATASRALGLSASPKASRPSNSARARRPVAHQPRHRAAVAFEALGLGCASAPALDAALVQQPACCRAAATWPCDRALAGRGPAAPARPARRAPPAGCVTRCLQHGTRQRVFAGLLQRGREAQHVVARLARRRACTATSEGRPSVSVPVLSKATVVTRMRQLQRLRVLDQDAVPRRHAGAHHDGGRRGQAQRAGAGDDQHGDGVDAAPCSQSPPRHHPGQQREQRHAQHHRARTPR